MKLNSFQEIDSSLKVLWGNPQEVVGISRVDSPKENEFCFIKEMRFYKKLVKTNSKTIIVLEEAFLQKHPEIVEDIKSFFLFGCSVKSINVSLTLFSRPFYDLKFAHLNYHVDGRQLGNCEIDPSAEIAQNVFIGEYSKIGANVIIMPGAVIMPKVEIGANTIIHPNVTIYPYSILGENCRIHSSSVIGSDGFGYNYFNGAHQKVWHFGGTILGDYVEMGAHASVNSGAFVPTRVGKGTKLDDFVMVAHNSTVGEHCLLCGQVCIGGSSELEDFCVLGGNAGLAHGAKISKGTQVAARGTVSENVEWGPGLVLMGTPAMPIKEWLKQQAKLRILAKG